MSDYNFVHERQTWSILSTFLALGPPSFSFIALGDNSRPISLNFCWIELLFVYCPNGSGKSIFSILFL